MLIPIQSLWEKYKPKSTGIIHVGGHWGEEYEDYKSVGLLDQVWIEPCAAAFTEMMKRINDERCVLIRCACGETNQDNVVMNVSSDNQGQSNSILIPQLHLVQHPEVKFSETELINIRRLDDLTIERHKYNFLAMDCQGYEGFVLKGGMETLKGIDYVYTEINRDEVYSGNTRIEEMDELLKDFTRVETSWVGNWGDSFFTRNKT